MTLLEAQARLAILANDNETPEETSEDWTSRTELLHDAVEAWQNEEGVVWDTLFAVLADAADGTKTTDGTSRSFAAPADLTALVGNVRLGDDRITVYHAWEVQGLESEDQFAYLTGKPGARKVTFNLTPDTGLTIDYDYIRQATLPTDPADTFDMTMPRFAIYWALAQINRLANDDGGFNVNTTIATATMQAMRVQNAAPGYGQPSQLPEAVSGGFGE